MAINKNFVIKNGVEVNTNLLVGDSTLNKVGIATTVPGYTLHIGVGDGARGGIGATDITVTGIATIGVANSTSGALFVTGISTFDGLVDANGGVSARTAAVQDLTAQRVVLAGTGGELEDSANLTFDGTTLTVTGDLDPTNVSIGNTLQVAGVSTFLSGIIVSGIGTFENDVKFKGASVDITFDQDANSIIFNDDGFAVFGTNSDMNITHSGSNGTLQNTTGDLVIKTTGSGDDIFIDSKDDVNIRVNQTQNAITCIGGGEVELYHGNTKIFQTTGAGVTVGLSSVQHNGNAAFAGITTVGGFLLVNSGVSTFSDTTQSTSATTGAVVLDGGLGVAKNVNIGGNLTVTGTTTLNGGTVTLGDADTDNVVFSADVDSSITPDDDDQYDLGSSTKEWRNLFIDGTANIDNLAADTIAIDDLTDNRVVIVGSGGELEDDANLTFDGTKLFAGVPINVSTGATITNAGNAAFAGIVTANGGIHVGAAVTVDAETGNVAITGIATIGSDTEATNTTSGSLIVAGGLGLAKSLFVGGALDVTSDASLKGNVDLGNATSDTISLTGRVDTDIVPSTDGARDLGSSSLEFKDLYVDGVGYIDSIDSDGGSFGNIQIGETGDNEIDTASGNLTIDSAGGTTTIDDALDVTGGTTTTGLNANGDVNLGDATSDTITATGRFDSDLVPSTDGARDLGTSSLEWEDLFIDGTATIDTLQVDENATITGSLTANGDVDLGNATSDTISLTGRVDTDIVPSTDGARDLGSSSLEFKDLFIDGTANIDSLSADTAAITDLTDNRVVIVGSGGELEDSGNFTFDGSTLTVNGSIDLSTDIDVDGTANLDILDVDGASDFGADVVFAGAASTNITFDQSIASLKFDDNAFARFGAGPDLAIFHNGTDTVITNKTGDLYINNAGANSDDIILSAKDDINIKVQDGEMAIEAKGDGEVILHYNANARVTTTDDGTDFGGTGSIRVPNGTTAQRNSSPAAGDFRYNTTTGEFEGYTDSWGAIGGSGGGVSETDTNVNGTTAVGVGSFSVDTHRSASILAQIDQGANYQVGRYLMIHDGTTVTVIEESAVATGSMLGSFSGDINHSNAELKVTMVSSGIATVTTKIDSITV